MLNLPGFCLAPVCLTRQSLSEIAHSLDRLEAGEPYLAVLGADTKRLGEALERELLFGYSEAFLETRLDEDAGNLHGLVQDWAQRPYIVKRKSIKRH